ncbi:MAG: sigma-54 dependent transcriptional regulator [Desulfobacterales bacterium]
MKTTDGDVNILVADDDRNILKIIKMRLEAEGYHVNTADNVETAVSRAIENPVDLALVDLKLADENGIELMEKLHEINPEMPIIILTAYGTVDSAVEAMQKGAVSYIRKPFDHRNLLSQIDACLEQKKFLKKVQSLPPLLEQKYGFESVIGKSGKMKLVFEQVVQAAATDSSVYIEGESGTGKELIARIVHAASPRRDNPFVVINCAAIPDTLFESELFGFEKGAFTGAVGRKQGFFAQANGGSFFLDEISEMPMALQTKLLRVVQEGEYYPLGSNKVITVDTRLISTSNRDLMAEVEKGNFREDLFYRIHVVVIKLPPLRERKEDIPLLAHFFLKKYCKKNKRQIKGFSTGAMQMLSLYDWPGNIRELKNEVESAVVMSRTDVIGEDAILRNHRQAIEPLRPFKAAKADFEKKYLSRLIDLTQGNMSQAAELSGKYRSDLYQLMKKYGLKPSEYRPDRE